MALRLRVVGIQAKQLGETSSKVFGVHGGTIGRAGDNDWILPDPERYVSGHHARIEYRSGRYLVVDTSSNGTYLNDAGDPISATGPYELRDGDRLRMGDYDMAASIDEVNDFSPEKSAIVAYDGVGGSAARKATENDIGASLNLDALLWTGESGSRSITPVNAYGQAVEVNPPTEPRKAAPRRPAVAPARADQPAPETSAQTPWNLATRRIEPYRNPRRAATSEAVKLDAESLTAARSEPVAAASNDAAGLHSLCRGAGIDVASIPAHMQGQVLQVAGQILREVMFGLMDVLHTRTELRNRFRIPQTTIRPAENNPLNFSAGIEEALRKLFEQGGNRYLGPVESVRESFREIKAHHQAMAAGMQAAFGEVLMRLDPAELQERFDRGLKRGGLLGATNKMKYWDLYAELYQGLGVTRQGDLPHLFVEEFARNYEAKLTELAAKQYRASGRGEQGDSVPAVS